MVGTSFFLFLFLFLFHFRYFMILSFTFSYRYNNLILCFLYLLMVIVFVQWFECWNGIIHTHTHTQLLIPYIFCPWFACRTPEKSKNVFFLPMGPREHPERHDATCSGTGVPKAPFSTKTTKMPLVNPGFNQRLNEVKTLIKQHFSWFYIKPKLLRNF